MDEEDLDLPAMSGRVGDLSPVQEEALKRVRDVCVCVRIVVRYLLFIYLWSQFKDAVTDLPDQPEKTDQYYLRWLRGRYR